MKHIEFMQHILTAKKMRMACDIDKIEDDFGQEANGEKDAHAADFNPSSKDAPLAVALAGASSEPSLRII
jgi:hypothetical protein